MVLQMILTYLLKLRPSQRLSTIRDGAHRNIGDGVTNERRPREEHLQLLELWENIWDPISVFVRKETKAKENGQLTGVRKPSFHLHCEKNLPMARNSGNHLGVGMLEMLAFFMKIIQLWKAMEELWKECAGQELTTLIWKVTPILYKYLSSCHSAKRRSSPG